MAPLLIEAAAAGEAGVEVRSGAGSGASVALVGGGLGSSLGSGPLFGHSVKTSVFGYSAGRGSPTRNWYQ